MTACGDPLLRPCSCPRHVHKRCIARWQLQSAGKDEETRCRFCGDVLPDWALALTPPDVELPRLAVMEVTHGARVISVAARPGPEGLDAFRAEIRRAFAMSDEEDFEFTFDCKVPSAALEDSRDNLRLKGHGAYDAAVHCAAVTKALRSRAIMLAVQS